MIRSIKKLARHRYDLLPPRFRYGRRAMALYGSLLHSQWYSSDQIEANSLVALKRLVQDAHDNSPFYARRFREVGVEPGDIKSLEDFRRLPFLTKDDIRHNLEEIKVREFEKYSPILTRTGGTTGAPLSLYRSSNTADMRLAVEWRGYNWGGHDFRERKMMLYPGTGENDGEEFFEDPRYRAIVVKSYEADEARMELCRDLFLTYKPKILTGIPQFWRVLGTYLEDSGYSDVRVDTLFIQGEAMISTDRDNFRKWFGARTLDFYGVRENAVSATECAHGNKHVNSEFTYMEFLRDGVPTPPGEDAEIVGTNLHNLAVPLIRYKTGDIGTAKANNCACGRQLPIMKIAGGRTRDYLTTRTKLVFICHHIVYLLNLSSGYDELQFYQPDIDHVVIRLVPNDNYEPKDTDRLKREIETLTRGELVVSVELVESIPRTRMGKYRFVVSEIEARV